MSPLDKVLAALRARGHEPRRSGGGHIARCPAHDDHDPSLSVAEGEAGRVLLKCHAGCRTEDVVAALGLAMGDLMPEQASGARRRSPRRRETRPSMQTYPTAEEAVAALELRHGPRSDLWTYENADGEPVGLIVRWDRPETDPETGKPKKDILPVSRRGDGWVVGGMAEPRPLYQLGRLASAKRVYVCEGEKAADAVRSVGRTATTSPHGSESAHKADWSPLAGKEVFILPDNDDAGQKYARAVANILAGLTPAPVVKVVNLPGLPAGGDAVEHIAARRAAGLDDSAMAAEIEAMAEEAEPMKLGPVTYEWECVDHNGRISLTARLGDAVLEMDKLDACSVSARTRFAKRLCEGRPGIDRTEVDRQLLRIAGEAQAAARRKPKAEQTSDCRPLDLSSKALAETDGQLVSLAGEFLRCPMLIEKIIHHVGLLGVAGEEDLALAVYVIGTSRLLPRPLAGLVMGASSAGKSYVVSSVQQLLPEEAVLQAHRLSPTALQHMKPGSLVHRFVVAGERSRQQEDAAAEATRALREMISDGHLSAAIAAQVKPGQWETVEVRQEGPIAYVESTTLGLAQIFDEDRTRFLLLSTDESQEQTKAVVQELARAASAQGGTDTPDSVIALHHAAQRLLEPRDVRIPFAADLAAAFPADKLEVRRTFGHLLSLIKAVALLHQYQRDRDDSGRIIALPGDYEVVRSRLAEPLGRSLGYELTAGARDMLNVLLGWDGEFTVSAVEAKTGLSNNTARGRIKELEGRGQIVKTQDSRGRTPASYAVAPDRPSLTGLALPALNDGPEKTRAMQAEGVEDNA